MQVFNKVMDNPGVSLFQGADIKVNNSQNKEEEEDLEDQLRRREELQNLLTNALDEFRYDDSTIHSSNNVSIVSVDSVNQNYKDAETPNDQLKILYEVRVREIASLRAEYEKYKEETGKEIEKLKSKLILSEAEMRQLSISLKNTEGLLVEKAEIIERLKIDNEDKTTHIKELEKTIENLKTDICIYDSTVNELQLKLHSQNNLFNRDNKFSEEEKDKLAQEKISRLENLLEEHVKKIQVLEKDKKALQDDLNRLLAQKQSDDEENKATVNCLTKTMTSAQQQCKDLINVVEMLHRENEHIKERLKRPSDTLELSSHKIKTLDNVTLLGHVEKLKKMVLDKSIEIDTLKSKLRHYESDIKELIEYRQLKADVYSKDFQQCNNKSHTKDLLLLQNDIQNYRRTIDDKNQEILNLTAINRELQEKIEEMILQTKTEIQNLSHKYSLPQLEVMSEELKNAETKIKDLTEKLEKSEERRRSLIQKYNKNGEIQNIQAKFEEMQQTFNQDRKHYEDIIKSLKQELSTNQSELESLQKTIEKLQSTKNKSCDISNEKQDSVSEDNLKNQYESLQQKLQHLEETVQDLTNAKTIAEGELHSVTYQLQEYKGQIQNANGTINRLENDVKNLKMIIEQKQTIIDNLQKEDNRFQSLSLEVDRLKQQLEKKEQALKNCEEEKTLLKKQQQNHDNIVKELERENFRLKKEISELKDRMVRRNLEQELRKAESEADKNRFQNNGDLDKLRKSLQPEILKRELKLREEIQEDYNNKINDIEARYQKACNELKEHLKQKNEKLDGIEGRYRKQFAAVLENCTETVNALEKEKKELILQITLIRHEFDQFKRSTAISESRYRDVVKKLEFQAEKNAKSWQKWSKHFVGSCLNIEATNKVVRDKILLKMTETESEIAAIERKYNEKRSKLLKNQKTL